MKKLFKDIPDGTHFEDLGGRKYIKVQTLTGSGNKQTHNRLVVGDDTLLPFNSIDYEGYAARCPDLLYVKEIS
jgi:hypothetical protein